MMKDTRIVTIPIQISSVYPDKNGRIFHKETMDQVFKKHGYLCPNAANRIMITPIPIRFFINATDYCSVITSNWRLDRQSLNTEEFTVNVDISDEELNAMQIMYVNDRYHINISITKQVYEKYSEYFSKCVANAICTELHAVDGVQMGVEDILYFDIFPDD